MKIFKSSFVRARIGSIKTVIWHKMSEFLYYRFALLIINDIIHKAA